MEVSSDNYANSLSEEGRYRLLVEAITDYAIYMLDPSGRVANWNAGAQRFKGYEAFEVIGRNFEIFYTDEDREAGLPAHNLKRAMVEGRLEQEGWRKRKDGSRFWAHVIIDRILDESGRVVGFAKVTRDLTERKETQRQLEEAREALFQAQKMEAIGQLTGGVAHDFNNLLMAVLGSLEIVQRRLPEESPLQQFVSNAITGAKRGAALTKRMLAFARRQELKMTAVDVAALATGMSELLDRSLGPSILINFQLAPNAPRARTDPAQLENAILNLAVNARDAMPDGGTITISTSVARDAPPTGDLKQGAYLVVAVEDEGTSMDDETLSHAAEPFFTTKEIGQGTGLGLAMVHGLAQQSGGRLLLHSRKGHGTRAEVWLPLADPEMRDLAEPSVEPAPEARALSVLAVDDDALVLLNTVTMLEELGHHVASASSAPQALELARKRPFDMVISDQGMPKMTGLQLLEAMRADGLSMPVLIATGYAELPPSAGVAHKLEKPFGIDELKAAIHSTMGDPR